MHNLAIWIPVVVAVVGAMGAYLAAVRKLSGTVGTSTADDLWEESRAIRQDYQRRIEELNQVIRGMTDRIDVLEKRNDALYLENGNLKRMIEEHEKTIESMREHISHLDRTNTELRQENVRLRSRVTELESNGSV